MVVGHAHIMVVDGSTPCTAMVIEELFVRCNLKNTSCIDLAIKYLNSKFNSLTYRASKRFMVLQRQILRVHP